MHIRKGNEMEDEFLKTITGIVAAQNQAVMSGIELGRKESAVRIKKLETTNAKMFTALKFAQSFFESITCHCAEGPEFFDRATLMKTIEGEAMKAYGDIEQATKEAEE